MTLKNSSATRLRYNDWLGLLVPTGVINHLQSTARAMFPCQPIITRVARVAPLPPMPTLWAVDVGGLVD